MIQDNFYVQKIRFGLTDKNKVLIIGWFPNDAFIDNNIYIFLDDKELEYSINRIQSVEVRQKYIAIGTNVSEEIYVEVKLPVTWEKAKQLKILYRHQEKMLSVLKENVRRLRKIQRNIDCHIEYGKFNGNSCDISGWAVGCEEVQIKVTDKTGGALNATVKRNYRKDIKGIYPEKNKSYEAGFKIQIPMRKVKGIRLVLTDGEKTTIRKISKLQIVFGRMSNDRFTESNVVKAIRYYKKNGFRSTFKKVYIVVNRKKSIEYSEWLQKHAISSKELKEQEETRFSYTPKLSIVIPLCRTQPQYLKELVESIKMQTYRNWELCLADGSKNSKDEISPMKDMLETLEKSDERIKIVEVPKNEGISGNTNAAIQMATGDYIVFSDHDDILDRSALFECVNALNKDLSIDVLYTDEDKIDMSGKKHFEPNFKSDYNVDMLCSMNYICHLFIVKKDIIDKVGMLRSEYDGAQDYDFILRSCEQAKRIYHIPKILYHWRCHMDSTAFNPESKLYAFEAGRRAIEAHYKRVGLPATVEHSNFYGMYRTKYHWDEKPLVSIIIPNKDHTDDLDKCICSIINKSTYQNFEFIIVENNSTEEKTFAYYKELEQRDDRMQVVYYEGDFNFSKINNFGVQYAKGDYFLLLNNDTEIINDTCIEEMLGYCMREDVGIVGARLYYEDDTIQHAGVVIGFGGIAGHTFIGESRYDSGYQGRIICAQDYSAVTAACMMTKRNVFEKVGGLTEELKVAFNDIDYCMKVRQLGYLVVYNPYAELYHYESKSRGLEDTPEKVERFNREISLFIERWPEILKKGDPYYNSNLTLDKSDFSLR